MTSNGQLEEKSGRSHRFMAAVLAAVERGAITVIDDSVSGGTVALLKFSYLLLRNSLRTEVVPKAPESAARNSEESTNV